MSSRPPPARALAPGEGAPRAGLRRAGHVVFRLVVLSGAFLAVSACARGVGRAGAAAPGTTPTAQAIPAVLPEHPQIGLPEGEAAIRDLLRDQPAVLAALRHLRAKPAPATSKPTMLELPKVEQALMRRYRQGGPAGPIRNMTALGTIGILPMAPLAAADFIESPTVEKAALWADTFRLVRTEYELPDQRRRRFWIDLLKRGQAPFLFDLRFGIYSERLQLPDGRVLLRYDPVLTPKPQAITMYRGAVLLEPVAGGTRVTEVLALGNAIVVPPPIRTALRAMVYKTQRHRGSNLWERAWKGREPK